METLAPLMATTPPTRLTLDRTVVGKLETQMRKPQNQDLKAAWATLKITKNERQDSVIWDPAEELIIRITVTLEHERTFMRKPDSDTYKRMTENIARCKRYLATHFHAKQ